MTKVRTQPNDLVELRLYDMAGGETHRLHEFVNLRWEENLVGGSGMLQATVAQTLYASLPTFARAELWVKASTTGGWECWWGGFIEEVAPESPVRALCTLVGNGLRRACRFLDGFKFTGTPAQLPTFDPLLGATVPYNGHPFLQHVTAIARKGVNDVQSNAAGAWAQAISLGTMTGSDIVGSATAPANLRATGSLEELLDTFAEQAQLWSRPLTWWIEPQGEMQVRTLATTPQCTLTKDRDLVGLDVGHSSADVINSACFRFGPWTYPDVLLDVQDSPAPAPNFLFNAAMTDWSTVRAATAVITDPDTGRGYDRDSSFACDGWAVSFGATDVAGLDFVEVTQGFRQPTDGAGNVAYPRGYGMTNLRMAATRNKGGVQFGIETAWTDRLNIEMEQDWPPVEPATPYPSTHLGRWMRRAAGIEPAGEKTRLFDLGFGLQEQMVADQANEIHRVDCQNAGPNIDRRIDLQEGEPTLYLDNWNQLWAKAFVRPVGAVCDYRWTIRTYPAVTGTPVGTATQAWQPFVAADEHGVNDFAYEYKLGALGLLGATLSGDYYEARWFWCRLEFRFDPSVTSAEVQIAGMKMEHQEPMGVTVDPQWNPDTDIRYYRNVEDADIAFAVTSAQHQSITDYGLRHREVPMQLPKQMSGVVDLTAACRSWLEIHSVPGWEIRGGYQGEVRRFKPQDGPVRLAGTTAYCGINHVLYRTAYELNGGAINPQLFMGNGMDFDWASSPRKLIDDYIPTNVQGGGENG